MDDIKKAKLLNLQSAIQQAKETYQLSGLAVAIAYGKEPIDTIVVGADEKGRPLTEDSLFCSQLHPSPNYRLPWRFYD